MSWWNKAATNEELTEAFFLPEEEGHPFDCECAWCLRESGAVTSEDYGSGSHGICTYHSEQEYNKYLARKMA